MSTNMGLLARRKEAVTPGAASVHPVAPDRSAGSYVWDVEGNKYLDLTTGIAVMNVGHSHPKVLGAVKEQIDRFQHLCFAVGMHEGYIALAERLNELAPGDTPKKTFFANTGAEAVENAVKIARAYTKRSSIVAFTHAFHGRTFMAMSLTAKSDPYNAGFVTRANDVYRAEYPYHYRNPWGAQSEEETAEKALQALKTQVKNNIGESEVAAFIIEPIAGEGGFIPAPETFLRGLREYATEIGALWIDDEIQAGMGRTGKWWAVDHYGLEPDIITSAKALSSGFPLSAVIAKAEIMDSLKPSQLGTTFGGNPTGVAAAEATISVIQDEGLLERATEIGDAAKKLFTDLQAKHKEVGDVRGVGAMVAVEFVKDADKTPNPDLVDAIVESARKDGLLLLSTGTYGNVIRLLPPLNLSDAELQEGLEKLEKAITSNL